MFWEIVILLLSCLCCQTSAGQDECVDNKSILFNGKLSCAEFILENPCICENQPEIRKHCCASCKETVCPKCRDYLSDRSYIDVTTKDGSKDRLTDCQDLVNRYISLCRKEYGKDGGACCETCSDQELDCIDDSQKYYIANGKKMYCAEYIAGDPCRCESTQVKQDCCASCENAVCDPCRDTLNQNNKIEVGSGKTVETLTDCGTLVDKYLILCRKYSGEGGRCCASCKGKDLDCVDNTLYYFIMKGKHMTCAAYVSQDKCRCKTPNVNKQCCASCKDVDLDACCQDSKTWKGTVKMSKKEKCVKCTCAEIMAKGITWMKKACRAKRSKARKQCCRSCTDVGYPP